MAIARVNGVEIAYETYGDGVPLVLAHGYTATKEMWDAQIGPFMERYRVVVYDVRGHGESETLPVDDEGYAIETLVADQKALLDHLGIEQAYIGGLSLGGMIAMRFALHHPQSVRALLLCDTSPGMGLEGQWKANRAVMEAVVRSQGVGNVMRGLYARRAAGGSVRITELPPRIISFLERQARMTPDGFLGMARAAGDAPSVLDRLSEITAPALIVTGDRDFFREASEQMHAQMPNSRLVVIEDSYHGTCLWQPEAFTKAVLDFLSDVEAGRPITKSKVS